MCHAYQLLKRDGLKDENIVVFMYDDIADNDENPYPGTIINHPRGSDVYAGVPKVGMGDCRLPHLMNSFQPRDSESLPGCHTAVLGSKIEGAEQLRFCFMLSLCKRRTTLGRMSQLLTSWQC